MRWLGWFAVLVVSPVLAGFLAIVAHDLLNFRSWLAGVLCIGLAVAFPAWRSVVAFRRGERLWTALWAVPVLVTAIPSWILQLWDFSFAFKS